MNVQDKMLDTLDFHNKLIKELEKRVVELERDVTMVGDSLTEHIEYNSGVKKESPAVEPKCKHGYPASKCCDKPEANPECKHITASGSEVGVYCPKCGMMNCKPSATEGQGIDDSKLEDGIANYLCKESLTYVPRLHNIRKVIELVRLHSLPKAIILIDRKDLEELLNKSVMKEYNGAIIMKMRSALNGRG